MLFSLESASLEIQQYPQVFTTYADLSRVRFLGNTTVAPRFYNLCYSLSSPLPWKYNSTRKVLQLMLISLESASLEIQQYPQVFTTYANLSRVRFLGNTTVLGSFNNLCYSLSSPLPWKYNSTRKFLQLMLISLESASLEIQQYSEVFTTYATLSRVRFLGNINSTRKF